MNKALPSREVFMLKQVFKLKWVWTTETIFCSTFERTKLRNIVDPERVVKVGAFQVIKLCSN